MRPRVRCPPHGRVRPIARAVTIYRPDGSARVLREDKTLDGEDILEGFSLPLARLFGSR